MRTHSDTIVIVSALLMPWGGCEDLWSRTVPFLQDRGYQVVVCKHHIDEDHPKIAEHIRQGVTFLATYPKRPLVVRAYRKVLRKVKQLLGSGRTVDKYGFGRSDEVVTFAKYLRNYPVKLVLVSQGINFEGLGYAHACMENDIPYVIVSHKAIDFYWPPNDHRVGMRTVLENARQCYFVSQHNKRLTEEQFGLRLPDSQVVFNPVKPTQHIPYPATTGVFHLCCIGRLFIIEKGQDILIRTLSQEKWKRRPVKVSIIGTGPDEAVLKELAELLGVSNVSFCGEVSDVYRIWQDAHALVMPSRTEGLPLVIVEAMMAGRPIITTDVGGNKEFLEEGVTGFIGHASDVSFGETLERAWQQRERWREMGDEAAVSIRKIVPESPERIFADLLEKHIHE